MNFRKMNQSQEKKPKQEIKLKKTAKNKDDEKKEVNPIVIAAWTVLLMIFTAHCICNIQ